MYLRSFGRRYSLFLGYPLKEWPGCGILAAFVFVLIVIVDIIIGVKPLSYGGSLAVAMIALVLVYKFLKIQKNSA